MPELTEDKIRAMRKAGIIDEREEAEWLAKIAVTGSDNVIADDHGIAVSGDVKEDVIGKGGTKNVNYATAGDDAQIAQGDGNKLVKNGVLIENSRNVTLNYDTRGNRLQTLKQRYFENFAHHCDTLPLMALGADKQTFDDVHLSDVYIELNTFPKQRDEKNRDTEFMQGMMRDEKKLVSVLKASAKETRIVLLGDPGSGKSTFVRQLAGQLSAERSGKTDRKLKHWEPDLFPLIVTLRNLAPHLDYRELKRMSRHQRQKTLLAQIEKQWQVLFADVKVAELGDMLDDLFASEKLLFIFDGFDELPEPLRPFIKEAMSALRSTYRTLRKIIVTSRIRSYHSAAQLDGFTEFVLAPFTKKQIKQFIDVWYRAQEKRLGKTKVKTQIKDLDDAIFQSDGLKEMARNPMLLTTMAIIHQERTKLPHEKVKVYKLAVDVLLRRWQEEKEIKISESLMDALQNEKTLRTLMEMIAYQVHVYQSQTDKKQKLTRWRLIELLQKKIYLGSEALAIEFLDYADKRAGLLVSYGGDEENDVPVTYDFPHRTFQEYLAGAYMVTGRNMERLYMKHVQEGDFWQVAALLGAEELYYNDSRGLTNLLNLMYTLSPQENPQTPAQWRAGLWSGQMAAIVGKTDIEADEAEAHLFNDGKNSKDYLNRLLPRLVQIMQGDKLPPLERVEAGRALARLGDPRPGVGVVAKQSSADGEREKTPLPQHVFCYIPAGDFWMGDDRGDDDEKPQHLQKGLDYGYWLSKYPVTVGQWKAFVAAGHKPRDEDSLRDTDNRPVRWVYWDEAVAYCEWLTGEWQAQKIIPSDWVVRLPSEAEWEKGARGGVEIPRQSREVIIGQDEFTPEPAVSLTANPQSKRRYPWGEGIDANLLNYSETGIGRMSAVGAFPGGASVYGCMDMSGNVWEWCSTKWKKDAYPFKVADEWTESYLAGGAPRVMRGGAFNNNENLVRCAFRFRLYPNIRNWNGGFRVVLSPF